MIKRTFVSAVLAFALAAPAAAQVGVQFPRSLVISSTALQAALQTPSQPQTPGPTTGQSDAGPRVPLTSDEAVKLALEHNLDIAVQRLNPPTYDLSIASIEAAYRPTVNTSLTAQSNSSPATNTISGGQAGSGIKNGTQTFNAGLNQGVKATGGILTLSLNNVRTTSTSLTRFYNPQLAPDWSASFTQPLMRNFRIDNNRQQLIVTKLNQDISDIQLQATITNTMANVRNAYWDYVFALQSVEVARQSLNLAEELVKNNETKVQIGTLAPIDVVQSRSQAAAQRQALVTAEGDARTAEIALKRLIVSGTADPIWSSTIDPVDRPEFRPEPIDVNAATQRALSNRTDLLQAKKTMQVNDVTLRLLRNQALPQADLVGRYGVSGLAGRHLLTSGEGVNRGDVLGVETSSYLDALSTLFRNDFPQWSVSMNFSYPIGMSAAEASIARARIQQNQIDAELRQIDLSIASDVNNAGVQVQNTGERVQAAQAARELAQQQLDAENSKFAVGMSTNFQVVQAQRDLATAQNNELQAILAYRRALVEFDRVQQTGNAGNITIIGR